MDEIITWARTFSEYTWRRLAFVSQNPKARLHETTITDDLVFQIFNNLAYQDSDISLKHAENEKCNGNDIEIAMSIGRDQFLIFPIQAKRIYGKYKYPRISHKRQIDGLISYASDIGGIPLYLFYNYYPNYFYFPDQIWGNQITKEQFGCTLVMAEYIKNNFANARKRNGSFCWRIPDFTSLHPAKAFPWHLLFQNPELFLQLSDGKEEDTEYVSNNIKRYTEEEITRNESWKPVIIGNDLFPARLSSDSITLFQEENSTFSPRFRIIINSFKNKVSL